jgi:hypothetical protein
VVVVNAGVWTSFSRHSSQWRVAKNFHLPNQLNNSGTGEEESVRRKKTLASLASWFLFLLANPDFTLHLANGYLHPWDCIIFFGGYIHHSTVALFFPVLLQSSCSRGYQQKAIRGESFQQRCS